MGCINVTSCIFEGCNNPNELRQHQAAPTAACVVEGGTGRRVGARGRKAGHGEWQGPLSACFGSGSDWGVEFGSGCCGTVHANGGAAWGLRWTMSEA